MKVEDLIKKYEDELLLCDDSIKHNSECYEFIPAYNWMLRKSAIHSFINDLKKLLV